MSSHALVLDDTAAARQELAASQYGAYPNAEELIRAQFASMSSELRVAVRRAENVEATKDMKKERKSQKNYGIQVPEGGKLRDFCVRGTDLSSLAIVYVWEDEQGNLHRGVQGYGKDYTPPKESPADRALREVAEHDAHLRDEAISANVQIDQKLAELRQELQEDAAQRFSVLREELVSSLKEILGDDAEKKSTAKPKSETGEGDQEVKYPRTHDELDKLAGGDTPEGWDEMKVDAKIEYLQKKGIKPEDEG